MINKITKILEKYRIEESNGDTVIYAQNYDLINLASELNTLFSLQSVSQQRELLNDFVRKYNASTDKFEGISEDSVDCYFKGIL